MSRTSCVSLDAPSPASGIATDHHLQWLCKSGRPETAIAALSGLDTCISDASYLCLLKACIKHRLPNHVKEVHAHIARHRAPAPLAGFVGAYLVIALARCGAAEDGARVSLALRCRSVFTWTAIISAYVERGAWDEALHMHHQMDADGIAPDSHTFVSLLKVCGETSNLALGRKFHADAEKKGAVSATFVGNSIVSMYGKCGAALEARCAFTSLPKPDVVSWNTVMSALVDQGNGEQALLSYRQMQKHAVGGDLLTYVIAFQACAVIAETGALFCENTSAKVVALDIGQALHADAIRKGYAVDVLIGTTLVSMYKKCRSLDEAENVFTAMRQHTPVSWTTMISAYVDMGHGAKALCLYRQMQAEDFPPNQLTFLFALQACIVLTEKGYGTRGLSMKAVALALGQGLHLDACRGNFLKEPSISSTLLTLYVKCGSLEHAEGLFSSVGANNVLLWTAMLAAHVEQEQSTKALQLFISSKAQLVCMDAVFILYILQACSAEGVLLACEELHFNIVSAGHENLPSVAASLIHAYAGSACTADLFSLFQGCADPNIVVWNSCCDGLAGGNSDSSSLQMFEKLKLSGMEPDQVTFSAVLSTCSSMGNISLGAQVFSSMIEDSGMHPDLRHYGIMVDLLARTGNFYEVENILQQMPMEADYTLWFCLLSACRIHGHVELAKQAFDQAVKSEPCSASPYVLLANVYAEAGLPGRAAEVRKMRCTAGAWDDGPGLE